MFRLFRPRKNIFTLGARVNHTQSPHPDVIRLQRVKFRRKRFRASNILLGVGFTYVYYEIITRTIDSLIGDDEFEMTEQERKEVEELDSAPLFIPFPGFTRTIEPLPYRGTDPEWQTYIKVNQDTALLRSVREKLAEVVRQTVVNHPLIVKRCGTGGHASRYWFDVTYPLKPPPTFVRQGLSIGGGDGITWTERPAEPLAVFWARQALWPSALTFSLMSFTSALMTQNLMTIAKFFGYESPTDHMDSVQQTIEKIHQHLKKPPGKPGSVSSPLPPQDQSNDRSPSSLPALDKGSTGSTATPETMGSGAGVDNIIPNMPSSKDMYIIRTAQEHTSGPWNKFKQNLAQKWRKPPVYPPRGSLLMTGLVEIITPRAFITVDCFAWWDPQTETFDPRTMKLQVRTISPKQQSPLLR